MRKRTDLRWFWLLGGSAAFLFIYFFQEALPFTMSLILAYGFSPLMEKGQRFFPSRSLRALILIFGLFFLCWMTLSSLIPSLEQECTKLAAKIPSSLAYLSWLSRPLWEELERLIPNDFGDSLSQEWGAALERFVDFLPKLFSSVVSGSMALASLLSTLCLIPIILFYLLRDWPRIVTYTEGLFPPSMRPVYQELRQRVRYSLGSYLQGQFFIALVLSSYYSLGLTIIGLESAVMLGVVTGFLSFVPFIGALVLFLLTLLICTAQYMSLSKALWLSALFLGAQLLETHLLYPRLVGKEAGLHPVWVLFALLVGLHLGGALGVIFAIPTASILGAVLSYARIRLRHSPLYQENA
ncbi:MAG: AI-2E family transporter [Holosporales bacterium]|jgi:predicted PurR-regulated permease PerM|nr:AI-2E family transporter [Holosporales bacterium]